MAKDPATLWYWNDFLTGTMTFSRHIKGCYMDLLGAQFNNGRLSLDEIKTVLGSDFGSSWPTLQKKFKQDDNGLFYNEKAEETKNKRANYTKSRRNNLKGNMGDHMENEIENRIVIEDLNLIDVYGQKMIDDFLRYWNEPNKKGKCRWELEKTWSLKGRLITWFNNSKKFNTEQPGKMDTFLNNFEEAKGL